MFRYFRVAVLAADVRARGLYNHTAMSLITRCPACRTMFKVVPDQLRISEGWVRCGQCEEIFDAQAYLQAEVPESPGVEIPGKRGVQQVALGSIQAVTPSGDVLMEVPARGSAASVDFELTTVQQDDEPPLQTPGAGSQLLPEGSAYGDLQPLAPAQSAHEGIQVLRASSTEATPPVSQAAELSFMRSAKSPSPWHRPLVRASLMVVFLLLGLGLVLQLLVHERDRVAVIEPGLKPYLEEICLLLACKVSPLRQIDSVVIDSSAFSKVRGDIYQLSLTLKNTAPYDLAMPAVELSLTDTLDHPLVRRVLLPEELSVRTGVIQTGAETRSTLVLSIKTNGNSERVAGYRLLAFYP